MTPSFALNNEPYVCGVNSKGFGERSAFLSIGKALAHFAHLLLCELGEAVGFTRARGVDASALCIHISYVIKGSSYKQMLRIYARWIVALVQAVKLIGYRAVVKLPTKAMCQHIFSTIEKLAVSMSFFCVCPYPALIWAAPVYSLPETLDIDAVRGKAVSRAESSGFTLRCPRLGSVSFSNRGLLSTATMTVAVGNILRGIMRLHGNLSFLCQGRGRLRDAARLFLLGCYKSNYSRFERVKQCNRGINIIMNMAGGALSTKRTLTTPRVDRIGLV
jgi:hypothetical protein